MLEFATMVGLSCFATVKLVRTLPYIKTLMSLGKKPFACNLCMSFWTAAASGVGLWLNGQIDVVGTIAIFSLSVMGICLLSLEITEMLPPGSPPTPIALHSWKEKDRLP